jgi:hypothetical protein
MDIPAILSAKYAGSEWTLDGDEYAGLTWLSDNAKPTEKQLESLWDEVQQEVAYKAVEIARSKAYRESSDPVFFRYQRGDATEAEWLAAVEAVKAAYPYPEVV